MSRVRLIVLGNPAAGDDAAALGAAEFVREPAELVEAGRPGARLLDLLSEAVPTVLADVTHGLGEAGRITSLKHDELLRRIDARAQVSSHGFGPAEALRLARALGRGLPPMMFVGVEGQCFDPGFSLTPAVDRALPAFAAAIDEAVSILGSSAAPASRTPD